MDKKQLASLVRMADHVEITQVMAELVQSFDRFDAMNILQNLMASDHPEVSVEFMEEGLYEGPEKVKAYMLAIQDYLDDPSDKRGFMPLQNLATPHIVVSTSGQRARAQWDILNASAMQATPYPGDQTKLTALWICGRYDNEFIKVGGKWKLLKLHLVTYFKSPFEEGWLKDPDCLRFGACKVEPTCPSNPNKIYHSDANYSGDGLHTYGPFLPEKIEDGPAPELVEDEATLKRIERAAAVKEIEMMQGRYLTLLDAFNMKQMCVELFDMDEPDVTFTMCEGGDYVGPGMKAFVENCNKPSAGNPMAVHGWFGMVCLWTPHIVVSEDGNHAWAQWNELAPHAMAVTPYPGDKKRPVGYWFIARYNNEYIKKDGKWKMLKNKVYSYARAPYELGWLKQADARRIMHDYHHAGEDPFQPQYRPANIYSGKGAHRWEPFLPEEAYGPKEAPQTDCADANQ